MYDVFRIYFFRFVYVFDGGMSCDLVVLPQDAHNSVNFFGIVVFRET